MKIHRFYTKQELGKGQMIVIEGDLAHQIRRVLRLAPGEQVVLFNGDGNEYTGEIVGFTDDGVQISIDEMRVSGNIPKRNVVLAISIPKKDTFERILEKGTELGVKQFIPILSDRSEKKDINIVRAERILVEAAEQSGRADLPVLSAVTPLKEVLSSVSGKIIAFHTSGDLLLKSEIETETITALIGPEGGWSDRDLAFFAENNIPVRTIGTQILRVETAAVAISTLFLF